MVWPAIPIVIIYSILVTILVEREVSKIKTLRARRPPLPATTTLKPIITLVEENVNPNIELFTTTQATRKSSTTSTTPTPPNEGTTARPEFCPLVCNLTQDAEHLSYLLSIEGENQILRTMPSKARKKRQVKVIESFDESWLTRMKDETHFLGQRLNHQKMTPQVKQWYRLIEQENKWKWHCPVCKMFENQFGYRKTSGIEPEDLLESRCLNSEKIKLHQATKRHQHSMTLLVKQENDDEKQRVFNSNNISPAMTHLLQLVYVSAQTNVASRSHTKMVRMIKEVGGNVGERYFGWHAFNEILEFLSEMFHNKLIQKIMRSSPMSIVLDASDDRENNHLLSISFVTMSKNRPVIYFYRLLDISNHRNAQGIMDSVISALKEDNLFEPVKANLVGISTDGAAVMHRFENSFTSRLKNSLGRQNVFSIW